MGTPLLNTPQFREIARLLDVSRFPSYRRKRPIRYSENLVYKFIIAMRDTNGKTVASFTVVVDVRDITKEGTQRTINMDTKHLLRRGKIQFCDQWQPERHQMSRGILPLGLLHRCFTHVHCVSLILEI